VVCEIERDRERENLAGGEKGALTGLPVGFVVPVDKLFSEEDGLGAVNLPRDALANAFSPT
jgi:hypothetical protein